MKFETKTVEREGLLVADIEEIEVDQVRSADSVKLSYGDAENDTTPYQAHVVRVDDEFPNIGDGGISIIHHNLLVWLEVVE